MHINSYLFPDYGGDEEERWSYVRRAASNAERRGAGKDLPFAVTVLHHRHFASLFNKSRETYLFCI